MMSGARSGSWMELAVDRPADGRRVVLRVLAVGIGTHGKQPGHEPFEAKQGSPMECCGVPHARLIGVRAGVEEPEADILRAQAGRPDERCLAVSGLVVRVGSRFQEGLDPGHLRAARHCAFEQQVGDVMQRVGLQFVTLAPHDQPIGQRAIGSKQFSQGRDAS